MNTHSDPPTDVEEHRRRRIERAIRRLPLRERMVLEWALGTSRKPVSWLRGARLLGLSQSEYIALFRRAVALANRELQRKESADPEPMEDGVTPM